MEGIWAEWRDWGESRKKQELLLLYLHVTITKHLQGPENEQLHPTAAILYSSQKHCTLFGSNKSLLTSFLKKQAEVQKGSSDLISGRDMPNPEPPMGTDSENQG